MSTSGSVDFAVTRDQIITAAAAELGIIAEGETPTANLVADFSLRLNSWTKSLMAQGARMWAMKQATLFLEAGKSTYLLGATGDHCTGSYVQTKLAADAESASTLMSLASSVGINVNDKIGVQLDNGAIHWTVVAAIGAEIEVASGLPSAATSGNAVFAYTTKINRPQRLTPDLANWRSLAGNDTPVRIVSREEYTSHTNKATQGKVVEIFYDKQLVNGILKVWPTPDNATDVLQFWYERMLEDFDAASNNPDFAIEWAEALILGLAYKMSPSYVGTVDMNERMVLKAAADEALAIAMNYDRENTSIFFQPDMVR